MSNDLRDNITLMAVLAFFIFILGFAFGGSQEMRNKEKEAVRKGHATWVSDKDGNSTFQWKEIK